MFISPGIIDEHSHIAISKGVNEGGQSISAEVSIADLSDCPLILYPRLPIAGLAQQVMQAFVREKAVLRVEQEVEDVLIGHPDVAEVAVVGLPGLASQLAYVIGLLTLVVCLHRSGQTTASLALGGMWVMFSTGSLSNVNFIHNYYTTGLSLMSSLGMVLLARPAFTDASAVKPQ